MNEDMLHKIKKLLALSKSTNEYEAQNAMIMAQRLLIKHKLSLREVEAYEGNSSNVNEESTGIKFRGSSWKSNLANVIANNFGTYLFYRTVRTHEICFYGKEEDITICKIVLEYAIKCINSNGDNLIKKLKMDRRRKKFKGIKDDYALGFVVGLDNRFKEQIKSNHEWGLILQKDEVVTSKYKEFSNGFGTVSVSKEFDKNIFAYNKGKEDGKQFDISNKIEQEGDEIDLLYVN